MKENTAMEQVGSGADRLDSFFTRRGFVKVSGAFVAGMVALGLLPDTAAAAPTSSKGEVDYYATPAHVLKVNRARCTGCQRCEMMCTLKNDGRVSQHIARVRVWQNYNWGTNPDGPDGIYKNCEFTVEHCKQCADPACMNYCPVHAIYADEESGARVVDAERCIGCGMCSQACPWNMPRVDSETGTSTKCVSCGRCAEQCPNGAIKFIDWEDIAQKVIDQGVVRTTTLVQA